MLSIMLTTEQVEEFRKIHHEVTGELLTFDEAREAANNLVCLGEVLMEIEIRKRKEEREDRSMDSNQ